MLRCVPEQYGSTMARQIAKLCVFGDSDPIAMLLTLGFFESYKPLPR